MAQFKELTIAEALDLVNSSSAFRGNIADWVAGWLIAPGAKVFVANVAPVNLHRKIGPIRRRTTLNFFTSAPAASDLRFKDSTKNPATCKLQDLGDEAVILAVWPSEITADGVSVSVEASGAGKIIEAEGLGKGAQANCVYIWRLKVIDRAEMVGWYDPGQLVRTAIDVGVSTIFGRNADYRTT